MSTTITRAILANSLSELTGVTPKFSKDAIEDLITIIQGALFQRDSVRIPKVCRIDVNVKKQRMGRNPKTGVPAVISARHSITASDTAIQREPIGAVVGKGSLVQSLISFGYSGREATAIVEIFYSVVASVSESGNTVALNGLGKFYPRTYKAGTLRNPKTGASVECAERVRVAFRASDRLRKSIDAEWL